MYYLYILRNSATDRYYIGSTNDLERRLAEHKRGKTRTTKVLKANELVHFEKYNTAIEERVREKKLKSYKSKKYLKWLIANKAR